MICNLNRLFFLLRGELCIYLYDMLNEYLSMKASTVDVVKMQSLFQVCMISVFNDGKPSTQRFIDSVSVNKRLSRNDREKGWDVIEVSVLLEYPLNIIISNSILQKYRNLFHLLLMLNVCVYDSYQGIENMSVSGYVLVCTESIQATFGPIETTVGSFAS